MISSSMGLVDPSNQTEFEEMIRFSQYFKHLTKVMTKRSLKNTSQINSDRTPFSVLRNHTLIFLEISLTNFLPSSLTLLFRTVQQHLPSHSKEIYAC